ncbi:hypothetical protein KKA03_00415 [archaeon]|nr:hypothetical protein [archaeon]
MHWREKELIEIIKTGGRLNTSDIVNRSRMCKVTALKYLKVLEDQGHVNFERIGPTKLWHVNQNDISKGGEGNSSEHYQNILRMLKEFEESTGKKGFVLMSVEDFDANPAALKVSLLEDGTPKFELKTGSGA